MVVASGKTDTIAMLAKKSFELGRTDVIVVTEPQVPVRVLSTP